MATPRKIVRLDEKTVNRIAAGEIIQRPSNALKELIENSLDAESTNIQISVKEGGLKFLQIQDNGIGIGLNNLDIVCERFTTSKLQAFEDLQSLSTYGFRGEALASISHVAQLTITTKTANEKCAYKASYIDGKLIGPPVACAGNQGTIITVENLFYNIATRRKSLNSISDELAKIVEVVTKYAIHNPNVGFTLKKHGETTAQVRTSQSSTKINNIRLLYGNNIAKELLEMELNDDIYKFKLHALVTNANYSHKRITLLLFINNRLIDSIAIKKTIEDLYSVYLPKKAHPWCYISLHIDPKNIDVNIHPTKHEVRFLHEDIIIEKIKNSLNEKLNANDSSRTFYIEAKLPKIDLTKELMEEIFPNTQNESDKTKKNYPKDFIRTSSSDQKLGRFNFTSKNKTNNDIISNKINRTKENINTSTEIEINIDSDLSKDSNIVQETSNIHVLENVENHNVETLTDSKKDTEIPDKIDSILNSTENKNENEVTKMNENDVTEINDNEVTEMNENEVTEMNENEITEMNENEITEMNENSDSSSEEDRPSIEFKSYSVNEIRVETKLLSILTLRKEIEDTYHEGLRKVFSNLIFIGCIDECSALIQSGVNLYVCNTQKLAEELFYEIMLYDFANYGVIKFTEPLLIQDLAILGLECEEAGWSEEIGPKEELAKNAQDLLLEKADMLRQYFSIYIDKKGYLKSLPILLENYFPNQAELPLYLLRLSTEVNWTKEKPCFNDICRETAKFYSKIDTDEESWKSTIENILYNAIKESLLPPKHFLHDSTILQITSLPKLYKIFERC